MTLQDAVTLIKNKNIISGTTGAWANLGYSSELFTYVLAGLLSEESTIYAIDKQIASFSTNTSCKGATIKLLELDFEKETLPTKNLNGIMMANSLHFVKHKKDFLEEMKSCLKEHGYFLIVEYDTEIPNHWVPYPVSFLSLKNIFSDASFTSGSKINERPSAFNRGNLYSAMMKR